jgi:hypothetical protein
MAWIDGSAGRFRLHDSDDNCGSMISLEDAAEIFDVQASTFTAIKNSVLKIVEIDNEPFINELDLHKAWGSGAIPTAHPSRIGSAKRSLDELILMKLIKVVYFQSLVTPQKKAGRQQADLFVDLDGHHIAVEFFGPSHFIPQYSVEIKPPGERKTRIEDQLGCECVIWPYWIQRCESSVRALFDGTAKGIASVWSTKAHFGDFVLPDSSEIVVNLSERFNAIDADGIGYMYLNSRTKNKPIHPIVKRIMDGKEKKERLIPRGSDKPSAFWLPECIESL